MVSKNLVRLLFLAVVLSLVAAAPVDELEGKEEDESGEAVEHSKDNKATVDDFFISRKMNTKAEDLKGAETAYYYPYFPYAYYPYYPYYTAMYRK